MTTEERKVIFNILIRMLLYPLLGLLVINGDWIVLLFFVAVVLGVAVTEMCLEPFGCFEKRFIKNLVTINNDVTPAITLLIIGATFVAIYPTNTLFYLFTLAVLLNILPVILNGGMMPILTSAFIKRHGRLSEIDTDGRIFDPYACNSARYCYTGPKTRLAFLGDNFCVFGDCIASVGDFVYLTFFVYGVIYQFICLLKPA